MVRQFHAREVVLSLTRTRCVIVAVVTAFCLASAAVAEATVGAAVTVTGELQKWCAVTLTFDGPTTSETADPNPFCDYRLIVAFTHEDITYVVPGFYAADGDAAETSASAGGKWRVHFTPNATGLWTWRASFRTGRNIAVSSDPAAGETVFFDGVKGTSISAGMRTVA